MRCPRDSISKLIHRPSRARGSSFEPVSSCTHAVSPKRFNLDRSGGVPYNASQGVFPPSARVDVRFFNHVEWRTASPHMFWGKAAICSSARTFSLRVRLRRSAIPFSAGVSWTVLSPSIGAQDLDGGAMVLRARPGLEPLVGTKDFAPYWEEPRRKAPRHRSVFHLQNAWLAR